MIHLPVYSLRGFVLLNLFVTLCSLILHAFFILNIMLLHHIYQEETEFLTANNSIPP
jgi:hypothetical protein